MLRCATQLVQRHMAARQLPRGALTDRCRSLLLPGGRLYQGPRACPYFAIQDDMALQLPHPASHCQEMWLKRLRAPGRLRPAIGEH